MKRFGWALFFGVLATVITWWFLEAGELNLYEYLDSLRVGLNL